MVLSDQEQRICTGIMNAAAVATGKAAPMDMVGPTLNEKQAKKVCLYFDLFQIVSRNNTLALSRMYKRDAGVIITEYKRYLADRCRADFTTSDVLDLKEKVKAFVKACDAERLPARILYIADSHFYHNRLCQEMDQRGFAGHEEMNAHMIAQWNQKVRPKDEVYILGDLSVARGEATNRVLDQLKGKLHLIVGNHDKYLQDKAFDRAYFESISPYKEIRDKGREVVLSHYPIFCYNGQYRRNKERVPKTCMLYGHTHNTHDERLVNEFIMRTRATNVKSRHSEEPESIPCQMINCFCMFSDYQPMTLDEWILIDEKRRNQEQ